MKNLLFLLSFMILISGCKKDEDEPQPKKPVYTKAKVAFITLTASAWNDLNGDPFDFSNGPDVYWRIFRFGDPALLNESYSYKENLTASDLPFEIIGPSTYITDWDAMYNVIFYDYDSPDADDYMGYVEFKVRDHVSDEQSKILTLTKGDFQVQIFLMFEE